MGVGSIHLGPEGEMCFGKGARGKEEEALWRKESGKYLQKIL